MKKPLSIFICAIGLLAPLSLNAQAQGSNRGSNDWQNGRPPRGGFDRRFERPENGGPRGRGMRRGPEKMRLMRTWRGISDLDDSKTPLSKAQAKKVVALVLPWSKKKTLSQTDATKLDDGLQTILTSAQKSALEDRPFGRRGEGRGPRDGEGRGPGDRFRQPDGEGPRANGPRGDGPRGDGPPRERPPFGRGPEEGGRGDGPPRGFDGPPPGGPGRFGDEDDETRRLLQTWMESYNPFYAPTGYSDWKKLPAPFQQDVAKRYRENRATLEALSRKSKA